jgi:hypothetical protein
MCDRVFTTPVRHMFRFNIYLARYALICGCIDVLTYIAMQFHTLSLKVGDEELKGVLWYGEMVSNLFPNLIIYGAGHGSRAV